MNESINAAVVADSNRQNTKVGETAMSGKATELHPEIQNSIVMFFHCKKCSAPSDMSPSDYQNIEAGWTEDGLQVWCKRHDLNIIHIDFEGHNHPAE